MLIRHSWDERFISKIKEIENKYSIEMLELDNIGPKKLDINNFTKDFFSNKVVSNVSADANANVDDDSILTFESEFGKSLQNLNSYYMLWKYMVEDPNQGIKAANKALELAVGGAIKIHDLHLFNKSYCYAFSLAPLISKGLPFIKKVKIGPPKHFHSFVNLVIQFIAYASNQIAGASALPDLFVYMDWYARKDFGENYHDKPECMEKVREELQSLVFSFNYPYRSVQSAFTNVNTYDKYFLKDLFGGTIYPDLSRANLDSIDKLQKFYMKWFVEESKTQVFTFPVNTATFYKDANNNIQDQDFLNYVSDLNCYNGSFNIFTGPLGVLASCCRLLNDTTKTKEYTNSFGAGGTSIGSHRVVTINLPRIAYEAENDEDYIKRLKYVTEYAQDILDIHRRIIINNINLGKLPLYPHGFMDLSRQFSTIGFIGINEACEIRGYDIMEPKGTEFAKTILNTINKMNDDRTAKDGHIRNMEQIPGESAAVMFAKKDKMLFTNHKYKLYGNQYIPLWKNVDIEERIKAQGMFDGMAQGGSILHINSSDSIDADQMKTLITTAAKCGCIYYAINMAQCKCNSCGKIFIGKFDKSPCHDATVTKYLRVVGFLVAVDNWISERREEYKIRQFYNKTTFIK